MSVIKGQIIVAIGIHSGLPGTVIQESYNLSNQNTYDASRVLINQWGDNVPADIYRLDVDFDTDTFLYTIRKYESINADCEVLE